MNPTHREAAFPYEGNPLLWQLPESRSFDEWADAIMHNPQDNWPIPLPKRELRDRIMEIDGLVAPLYKTIRIAEALQRMHRHELIARDPRVEANRKAFFEKAKWKGAASVESLPWFPNSAGGSIVQGPTGTGKSHAIEAALRGIPNVLLRQAVPGAFLELQHLVHMTVHMPSDGSRGGLLFAIVCEMDRLLGTDYRTEYRVLKTIDKQLVQILMWLMQHRCGMLIIEESQEENITTNTYGKDFVQFFMRVLNFGVPVVLIGNPLAFEEHINRHSQVLRRLSYYGNFQLNAFPSYKTSGWSNEVMPLIWGWTVFEEPDEAFDGLDQFVWERTGGIDEMVTRLRRETMLAVLDEEGCTRVSKRHIEIAYESEAMTSFHPIIEAYRDKKPSKLIEHCDDQPIAYLRRKWGLDRPASPPPAATPAPGAPVSGPAPTDPANAGQRGTQVPKKAAPAKRPRKPKAAPLPEAQDDGAPIAPPGNFAQPAHPSPTQSGMPQPDELDRRSKEFRASLLAKSKGGPGGPDARG